MDNIRNKIYNINEISKNMEYFRKRGGLQYGFPKCSNWIDIDAPEDIKTYNNECIPKIRSKL